MFEKVIEDLDVYSFRSCLSKWQSLFMIFIYPTTMPTIEYRYGNWITQNCKNSIIIPLFISYLFIKRVTEILTGIEIGHDDKIGKGLYIAHLGDLVIGNKVQIDDYCSIRNGVSICSNGIKKIWSNTFR